MFLTRDELVELTRRDRPIFPDSWLAKRHFHREPKNHHERSLGKLGRL